nr:hypothetical protein [Pigmentiphaga aceris]
MDIYVALGSPPLFAIGNDKEHGSCLLARAANDAMVTAMESARLQFEHSLRTVTVADLAANLPAK